jgi:hypothetical protein
LLRAFDDPEAKEPDAEYYNQVTEMSHIDPEVYRAWMINSFGLSIQQVGHLLITEFLVFRLSVFGAGPAACCLVSFGLVGF